jgi:hypothetical protein
MNKVITAIVLTLLFGAGRVFAQSYYQSPTTYQAYSGGCVSISRDLSVGSTGTDVLSLQKFIVSRNYPGGGAWMMTSYYGAATRAGVINMQIDMRLPQTGILDSATRAALTQMTCLTGQGGYGYSQPTYSTSPTYSSYPYNYSYTNSNPWNYAQPSYYNPSTNYSNSNSGTCGWYTSGGYNYFNNCGSNNPSGTIYPNYNQYPYNNYGGQNSPTISNISGPTSINVNTTGTWIISVNNPYGSTYTSVSVNWGENQGLYMPAPQQVYGNSSATFTHAYAQPGTYTITVTVSNTYGSNTSTQTVQVNGNGNNNNGTPWIYSVSPTYGSVGTQITIYGTGFNGDNIVHFGNGGQAHVTSASGNYIYYTVPSSVTPCTVQVNGNTGCPQYAQQVTPGQYQMYVTTNGVNSNSLTFTVQ